MKIQSRVLTSSSTGCVVAGRLAYADPNLKVMLIEGEISVSISNNVRSIELTFLLGGANNRDDPWVYR
jgi:alcohol oxidase